MTAEHTYTFDDVSNSYFMGSDVHVTRDDGKTVIINGKDGMCAIRVKDHALYTVPSGDAHDAYVKLEEADREREIESAYESAREQWWEDANELALERGFQGVYSAGRSSGWCCIDGTREDDWPKIAHPEYEDEREFRDNFLELAFELVDNIEHSRSWFHEQVIEAANELDAQRAKNIVLGEN